MHTSNTASNEADPEDALKVLGRVADAFDNPSLHKTDKELKLFMVNVVKSRHLLTSIPSEESICQDETHGSYDSSFDTTYDEDMELVELGDVSIWEHGASYPYTPQRCLSHHSERRPKQDKGTYEVTKMVCVLRDNLLRRSPHFDKLLTSSPLDRLDRLARMELRKTGWIERVDKWTLVEMGLQAATPPRTPSRNAGLHTGDISSTKTTLVNEMLRTRRPDKSSEQSARRRGGYDTPERNHRHTGAIKPITPVSMRSTGSQDLADMSTLSFSNVAKLVHMNTTTPVRASRFSRQGREQSRGRLGQVVRNIVKRMLPPSPPQEMTPLTPRSDDSDWTFGSASSWMEARRQRCQTTNRWSGFNW